MEIPEPRKRSILLSETISQVSARDVVRDIIDVNEDDNQKEKIYKDWKREPILIFINSFGGGVYDGIAIIDAIKQSKTPVTTICIGSCMSMALWIFLAAEYKM